MSVFMIFNDFLCLTFLLGINSIYNLIHYHSFFQSLIFSHDYNFLCFALKYFDKSMTVAIHSVHLYRDVGSGFALALLSVPHTFSIKTEEMNRRQLIVSCTIVLQLEAHMALFKQKNIFSCYVHQLQKEVDTVLHSKWPVYSSQHSYHCYRSV